MNFLKQKWDFSGLGGEDVVPGFVEDPDEGAGLASRGDDAANEDQDDDGEDDDEDYEDHEDDENDRRLSRRRQRAALALRPPGFVLDEGEERRHVLSAKRRRRQANEAAVKRGMERHVVLVIDISDAMSVMDFNPFNRRDCTLVLSRQFVRRFFEENPISQLSVVVTANGRASKLSSLSANPNKHIELLTQFVGGGGAGLSGASAESSTEPSLQNALELAGNTLRYVPKYSSREVVCIMASLTTRDPGNVQKTIEFMKNEGVRCSVISLACEVRLYRHLAEQTGGVFCVPLNVAHYKELMLAFVKPPPLTNASRAELIVMGFPVCQNNAAVPFICSCHDELKYSGFCCPQCQTRVCSVPTTCPVCQVTLLSSEHVARAYHHLFPVAAFTPAASSASRCAGCFVTRTARGSSPKPAAAADDWLQCPHCNGSYCPVCEEFVHELLQVCVRCAIRPHSASTP